MDKIDQKSTVPVDTMFAGDVVEIGPYTIDFLLQSGVADVSEAAGTIVIGQLPTYPVFNKIGDRVGEYTGSNLSTSLVFTTGVMDSTKEVGFEYNGNENQRITKTVEKLSSSLYVNGSWALDYISGLLIVKKKTTGASQVITSYKVKKLNLNASVTANVTFPTAGVQHNASTSAPGIAVSITSAAEVQIFAANANRDMGFFYNKGPNTVYVGLTGVDTTKTPVIPTGSFEWPSQVALYGINASGETSSLVGFDFTN